nr:tetrahydrofolate synthase [Segatella salivae]
MFINHRCCWCYAGVTMDVFAIANLTKMQRCRCHVGITMNVSAALNTLTTQLGTSCSFDSPGLARNEPTPGKRSQGDSTP